MYLYIYIYKYICNLIILYLFIIWFFAFFESPYLILVLLAKISVIIVSKELSEEQAWLFSRA